MLRHRFFID